MAEVKRLAVIGDPIAHSLSPALHNAMARELGLSYTYEAVRVAADALPDWLARVRAEGWRGFNATMPHKLRLPPLLDGLTPEGEYYGAVNTVKNENGVLTGHNTDGEGFARMLAEHGRSFAGTKVTVLGAGGAAGAIVRRALRDGAARVTVLNRTLEKAEKLRALNPKTVAALPLDAPVPPDTGLLINTLPAGTPLDWGFAGRLDRNCAVFDILYAPPKTALLEAAEARGLLAVNGLGMLIHQAIPAFSFFTGAAVDETEMAKLLYREIRHFLEKGGHPK